MGGDVSRANNGSPVVRPLQGEGPVEQPPTRVVGSPVTGTTETAVPIQLTGEIRRLDHEIGEESTTVASDPSAIDVEFENLRLDIDPNGIDYKPEGHCKLITPLINVKAADEIENPIGRGFVKVTSGGLDYLHTGINYVYAGVTKGDEYVFERGLDRLTGLNEVEGDLEMHLRWLERGLTATGAAALVGGLKSKSLAGSVQGMKGFWGTAWPIAALLYLSKTKLISQAKEGFDLTDTIAQKLGFIEEGEHVFEGESRRGGRALIYGASLLGAAALLNLPANAAYRRVVHGKPGSKPMGLGWGLAIAGGYFVYQWYWDNASTQQRILPGLHNQPSWHGYIPWKWDTGYTQSHTTVSGAVGWGLTGATWGSLLFWQTAAADKVLKTLTFGKIGKHVLDIPPGSWSERFINGGSWGGSRAARAFVTSFTPKRFAFNFGSAALVGLPLGAAVLRLTFETQDYSSQDSVTGTPARAVITSPLSAAGIAACYAAFGVAHSWCAYAFNMPAVNYPWEFCSKQGENVYQAAKGLADDYESTTDPNEKRHLRTMLFNLNRIAHGNEKDKIRGLLAEVNVDVSAIENAAMRYATP